MSEKPEGWITCANAWHGSYNPEAWDGCPRCYYDTHPAPTPAEKLEPVVGAQIALVAYWDDAVTLTLDSGQSLTFYAAGHDGPLIDARLDGKELELPAIGLWPPRRGRRDAA